MYTVFKRLLFLICLIGIATGCTSDEQQKPSTTKQATLVYIQWDEGVAYTHLVKNVLEKYMNYEVTLVSAELEAAYQIVAENGADAFMESWQPVLHKIYLDQYEEHLTDLGPVFDSTKSGLVVPEYMPVDSIRHLQSSNIYQEVNGTINGIEPGAGIMKTTRQVLEKYKLPYELQNSSEPAMIAALERALEENDPIIVTGWKPHWMFGKWNLKFLKQDRDKQLWTEGAIHIVGSKNIEKEKPRLARFLRNMNLTEEQLYDLMLVIENRASDLDLEQITRQWMQNHSDLVEQWIPQPKSQR